MTFADELLKAGKSALAVMHEFLLQHDPKEERVHAFCEGYEDPAFYKSSVEKFAETRKLFFYRCHGKAKTYKLYSEVTARVGHYRHVLFFVDKDLSDVIPEIYPTDERIYVTDYYSVENYLVTEEIVRKIFADYVILKKCILPKDAVPVRFSEELKRFRKLIMPIMAWTVCLRRKGYDVALQNLKLQEIFFIDDDLRIHRQRSILGYLIAKADVPNSRSLWSDLKVVMRELIALQPQRVVRGKFEGWFLVQFVKAATEQVRTAAQAKGGDIEVKLQIEQSNMVSLLAGYSTAPDSLARF